MDAINRYAYRLLVTATLILLGGGAVFYHMVEKWNWVDSYYFCVVTLATVGYGDLVPQTTLGKLFTTFYILVGIGIIAAFASAFVRKRGIIAKDRFDTNHKQ